MYAVITEQDIEVASGEFTVEDKDHYLKVILDNDQAEGVANFLWRTRAHGTDEAPEQWQVHWRGNLEACLRSFSDVAGDLVTEQAVFLEGRG